MMPDFSPPQQSLKHWKRIGSKHHHGIVIPLFSIHSKASQGIGEYTDIPLLIDWCVSVGLDIIQFLPLNDSGNETSPYAAISAFALNPLFIGLHALPYLDESPELQKKLRELPAPLLSSRVDYAFVRKEKMMFLKEYYAVFSAKIFAEKTYQDFVEQASYWLKDYAFFCLLREKHHFQGWEAWSPKEEEWIQTSFSVENRLDFLWYYFLQFLCDQQMQTAKKYAEEKGVFLMGDIPILISRDSADVWKHQRFFDLNYTAGAPPDMFSEEGQNWGFPLYNWQALSQENYRWWRERLAWASRYTHLYRVDHIVGFFRIWGIPLGQTGQFGHFIPEDPSLWMQQGKNIMQMMLESSPMLPIGEDLGVVPDEVRSILREIGICGTKVMRWERKWHEEGRFIPLADYPLESMTTISTHDSETVQQWWEKYPIESQLYAEFKGWNYETKLSLEHRKEILYDSHHTNSLFHINLLQEYLCLIPELTWEDPNEERINIPGLVLEKNWSYRLKLKLEDLQKNEPLKAIISQILSP